MAIPNPASGPPPITHLAYRPDIDGIRAVAVLSVVCYHAYPQKFFSGFIGVDIFFVISGLITTILLGGLQKRQFNLLDFSDRRIRRISSPCWPCWPVAGRLAGLPCSAMSFSCWASISLPAPCSCPILCCGTEHGYFSASSDSKPLLHLWSLGIEEQFYIFWPGAVFAKAKVVFNP